MAIAAVSLAGAAFAPPAEAAYIVNFVEVGGDVVATGSGSLDLADLTLNSISSASGYVKGSWGIAVSGGPSLMKDWTGFSGPSGTFGPGAGFGSSTDSGDLVGIALVYGEMWVKYSYVSGASLSSSSTWTGATLGSLGLTTGSYTWTWGSGEHADSYTLNIGETVPEPTSLALLGLAAAGLAGFRWRRPRAAD